MNKYLIKHNCTVYRPMHWSGDYIRRYGENNNGFIVQADSIDHAKHILKNDHNINPFYVTIEVTK